MDTIQDCAKLFAGLMLLQKIADHEFTAFIMHFVAKLYFYQSTDRSIRSYTGMYKSSLMTLRP